MPVTIAISNVKTFPELRVCAYTPRFHERRTDNGGDFAHWFKAISIGDDRSFGLHGTPFARRRTAKPDG